MPRSFPDRLELRQRMYMWSKSQQRAVTILGGLVIVAFVILTLLPWLLPGGRSKEAVSILEKIVGAFRRDPVNGALNLVVLAAVGAQLYYFRMEQRVERLILTRDGVEYRSPLPAPLRFLHPGWSLAWNQIRVASLEQMPLGRGPQRVVLQLDGGTRKFKVFPWHWVDPEVFASASPWKELRRMQKMTPEETAAEIDASPVIRYLAAAAPHVVVKDGDKRQSAGFALEKNPRSLTVVVLFFVLSFYALIDGIFLGEETYAAEIPFQWFTVAGVVGGVVAALWMWRGAVPSAEGLIVAVLFGGALGAAAYPGALRINALTDTDGLRKYDYELSPNLTLKPVEPGPPELYFPEHAKYWMTFRAGSIHEFELRRGGLEFYQLNFEPVRKNLRAFYENDGG
jgi:hypothetical protein